MFFETKIENRFKGTINGVEFDNQELFYATESKKIQSVITLECPVLD